LSEDLETRLYGVLANRRWAHEVATGGLGAADRAMDDLTDEEWLAAMEAHPRIGEPGGHSPANSEREQSRAMQSSPETLAALAAENRRYEAKFGHVFLIAASGRSGDDILAELRRRMSNKPAAELLEAKRELRKIVHVRLEKLVSA
jgi:2-oxo-4-hydroxy-4-carboxy-5-ureidoimidazoline decarboxylase